MNHLIAIASLALACAVWIIVQRASERLGIPGRNGGCHSCGGTGGSCLRGGHCANRNGDDDDHEHEGGEHCATHDHGPAGLAILLVGLGLTATQACAAPSAPPANEAAAETETATAEPATPSTAVERETVLMGTRWAVRALVPAGGDPSLAESSIDAAFAEVARIETVMSEWQPDTPISAVNQGAGTGPVEVPAELVDIVRRGIALGEASDGAFDITWHALADVWPIYDETFRPPDAASVEAARRLVDFRAVATTDTSIALEQPGMSLGLGGIAKGYAIDRAGATLRDSGVSSFYVDGGGDVLVGGGRDGSPWRVGIRAPRGGRTDLIGIVRISDGAVATSGDYERARIVDGVRYSHILDPRTGAPAVGSWSVTIVAPTAEEADGTATAVFVLGPERGLAFVDARPGVEALVVDDQGVEHMTDGFRALFVPSPS